jgi:RNA polymerase sigma-70 factor, ECF subfamily
MSSSSFDPRRTHASLLIRIRDSADQEAWKEFHDLYAPMIRGWCRHWFPRELDDMVQEVLIRLVRCLKAFEYEPGKGRFRGYIKTVTNNLMSELKKRSAPPQVVEDEAMLSEIEARQDLEDRLGAMFDL